MISSDPSKRITVEQALNHRWVRSQTAPNLARLDSRMLTNLQAFCSLHKLKKAVLVYIVTQTSERETEPLRRTFSALDKDGDGKISRPELEDALSKSYSNTAIKAIIDSLDADRSGFIDYSGTCDDG
jgi:calcium-dependent protein kinase